MRAHFTATRDAVLKVLDPARLRWLSFSHFEVDECGALNDWLRILHQFGDGARALNQDEV
ncbi:MAG: hypothetical protein Q8R76_06045 [Candidatus Omnitrophota bacterium]|nr:hypothetical protein [Candidatus Omnitrophota bacterium]